jgi:endoribonuclease Dicer
MIQQDDTANLSRYRAFMESEPELKRIYQSRLEREHNAGGEEGLDDDDDAVDLAERERYVVASTGAFLTYDNAINLLNYLCSLIPCDSYTKVHTPKYTGDFEATLQLPPTLPLPPKDLKYIGPRKHSIKEAKRAVAFLAVKALHALNVFDDYLLPISVTSSRGHSDADGRLIRDVNDVPEKMDVSVRDPWCVSSTLFLHPVYIDGRCNTGIVTSTMLPDAELQCDGSTIAIHGGRDLSLDEVTEWRQRETLREFTRLGIWYCITASPLHAPLSVYLVPLTETQMPDYEVMDRLVGHPFGNEDWSMIGEEDHNRLMLMNSNQFGLPLLLRGIRYDLSPMSVPPPDCRESTHSTYRDYFLSRWSGKKRTAKVPLHGPLLEVQIMSRHSNGRYSLKRPVLTNGSTPAKPDPNVYLVPQGCCRWVGLSENMRRAFRLLPSLCHRSTDIYRVRQARVELGLPPISDDLLVEAFTLPSADAGFNNQRLETLGDSVLKLATTVHVFNKYPYRHEGQLSHLRQICVSNRTLLARAKDIGLECFLISEGQDVRSWRYTAPFDDSRLSATRFARRQFSRRSLQDCMEATLGASFLTGGIPMALRAGEALGLAFGGPIPWSLRYSRSPEASLAPALFERLQENLGYTFHSYSLLREAVTHPSFAASSLDPSYQRLEFLGDGEPL